MPVPPADRPPLGPWQMAVVRVEETMVEDATEVRTPYTTADRRRPIDLPEVEGNDGPSPRAGVRRCEGPAGRSSHAEKTQEPFRIMVHEQTDPAGQFCAGTLSPFDCYPVGPVGLVATGGPVGPDVYFTNPNLLTHVIRTPPCPDGQDATTGPVGLYVGGGLVGPDPYLPTQVIRTSPDPDGQDDTIGPAGLYIGGGPVDQAHSFSARKSRKHMITDDADPVVQHEVESDTVEGQRYEVVANIRDARPTKGITWQELLAGSIKLLDSSLDGKLEEDILNWEPEASLIPENLTLLSTPMTSPAWPCVDSPRSLTVENDSVNRNRMKDSREIEMTMPENAPPLDVAVC